MKPFKTQILLALSLTITSCLLFELQVMIFHDFRNTLFYLLQDIAFIPIQVLLVTLVIQQFMEYREKTVFMRKLNMVIGSFFSELGNPLLIHLAEFDADYANICTHLHVTNTWTPQDFDSMFKYFKHYNFSIDINKGDLPSLKSFLQEKKSFVLRLLANPNLLEHDRFTELLWAVHHLQEELYHRHNPVQTSPPDQQHLALDIKRAYSLLLIEWFEYLSHLKKDYPYLFSLALRTNPYDKSACVEIKD